MSSRFDGQPRFADPMPDIEPDEDRPAFSSAVAESAVHAHQSTRGENVLNIEVDAPAGVTVRLHINDGHAWEGTVPN